LAGHLAAGCSTRNDTVRKPDSRSTTVGEPASPGTLRMGGEWTVPGSQTSHLVSFGHCAGQPEVNGGMGTISSF
jgi:hypothetical protein